MGRYHVVVDTTKGGKGKLNWIGTKDGGEYRGSKDATSLKWCERGDVWKYGKTQNPGTRYSQRYLDSIGEYGVSYWKEFDGTSRETLTLEPMKIRNHLQHNDQLPPGNKIIR